MGMCDIDAGTVDDYLSLGVIGRIDAMYSEHGSI